MKIFEINEEFENQIQNNILELESYKDAYIERIKTYNSTKDYMNISLSNNLDSDNKLILNALIRKIDDISKEFNMQITKIDRYIDLLSNLLYKKETYSNEELEKIIKKYNQKYIDIKKNNIVNSWIYDNKIELKELCRVSKKDKINKVENNVGNNVNEKLKIDDEKYNNNTLLISQAMNMVVLPYTQEEINKVLNKDNNKYITVQEVINDKFVRKLSDYKYLAKARYNETIELAKKEGYKKYDIIKLANKIKKKDYIHPAIITACKKLDDLMYYIECVEEGEEEKFKLFKIEFEACPLKIKQEEGFLEKINIFKKSIKLFSGFISKNTKKGRRYS